MKKMYKIIFVGMLWLCCYGNAVSQDQEHKKLNYSKDPHWIQYMEDPNVNYHEAKKAFDEFWKDRGEPEEEEHGESKGKKERSLLKRFLKSDEKLKEENQQYLLHYKKFKRWQQKVEPFVQSDGSILSEEEQRAIWENARK